MARPFLRYLGGKREHVVITRLQQLMPAHCTQYIEPFVGAGAAFFGLEAAGLLDDKMVLLGDLDAQLISLYRAVRRSPSGVHRKATEEAMLIAGVEANTEDERKVTYFALREAYNFGGERGPGIHLCLRHAAFNGMFRVNAKGEVNITPRDKLDRVHLPLLEDLVESAEALENVELLDWNFRQYEEQAFVGPETLIYLDPPYDGGFVEYTKWGFSTQDQQALIELACTWSRRGATVVYSNKNSELIQELLARHWPEAVIEEVRARRSVACTGDRTPAPEVLVHAP